MKNAADTIQDILDEARNRPGQVIVRDFPPAAAGKIIEEIQIRKWRDMAAWEVIQTWHIGGADVMRMLFVPPGAPIHIPPTSDQAAEAFRVQHFACFTTLEVLQVAKEQPPYLKHQINKMHGQLVVNYARKLPEIFKALRQFTDAEGLLFLRLFDVVEDTATATTFHNGQSDFLTNTRG